MLSTLYVRSTQVVDDSGRSTLLKHIMKWLSIRRRGRRYRLSIISISLWTVIINYPRRLCQTAWEGRSRSSVCVCLSVCPQHNSKTNDPKVFNLGMTSGYTRSDMVLGLNGQRSRSQVNNATQRHFILNYNRASFTFARWRNWQEQYGVDSNSMSIHSSLRKCSNDTQRRAVFQQTVTWWWWWWWEK